MEDIFLSSVQNLHSLDLRHDKQRIKQLSRGLVVCNAVPRGLSKPHV
jgi:hypothetical protein